MTTIYKSEHGKARTEQRYLNHLDNWPVPAEHLRIRTREGETFVVASGPIGARPLVLLHGSGGNSANWRGDIEALSAEFRTYSVDLVGEPGFSAPSRPDLDSDAVALWLGDVFDGLGVRSASVLGMSLGGWTAADFATRHPGRVDKLVLLCPGGIGKQTSSWMITTLPLMMLGHWGTRRAAQKVTGLHGPELAPILDEVVATFGSFRPRRERLPIFPDDALARLTMPVQLTVGARDVMFDSKDTVHRVQQFIPHAEIHGLPDAGHAILGRTASILEFLRS